MNTTTSLKEVHQLICVVSYYRNMWARHSHTLTNLTNITSSKEKFKWAKIEQDAFDEIKRISENNILSAYPDFNEEF